MNTVRLQEGILPQKSIHGILILLMNLTFSLWKSELQEMATIVRQVTKHHSRNLARDFTLWFQRKEIHFKIIHQQGRTGRSHVGNPEREHGVSGIERTV